MINKKEMVVVFILILGITFIQANAPGPSVELKFFIENNNKPFNGPFNLSIMCFSDSSGKIYEIYRMRLDSLKYGDSYNSYYTWNHGEYISYCDLNISLENQFITKEGYGNQPYTICNQGKWNSPESCELRIDLSKEYFNWKENYVNPELSCQNDSDCYCGVHKVSSECFVANKNYLANIPADKCDDFCSGFAGPLSTKCINNTCVKINISELNCSEITNPRYCSIREDCEFDSSSDEPKCKSKINETCIEKNGSCCKGDVCNAVNVNCIVGTFGVFNGCDNNCMAKMSCENKSDVKKYFNLSNGRQAEIKIIPETASQTAIARLGELNFTIELKEVGQNKTAYELTADKQGKFLGIIETTGKVKIQIDAESGEMVYVKKPWWAFLATRI